MPAHVSRETPSAPEVARRVFSDALPQAERFTELLATEAARRGLIGPREVPRLWERHLLNCAPVTDLIALGARVADVGSGAGLPGLVLAIRRADLQVTLIEPLLRRTIFLDQAVTELGLGNVWVVRGRAEDLVHDQDFQAVIGEGFDVVTSRAVAPMDRLARWSLPLVRSGGLFLAMKGSSAESETRSAEPEIRRLGGEVLGIEQLASGSAQPVTVVKVHRNR